MTARGSLALPARTVVRARGGVCAVAPCVRHQPSSGIRKGRGARLRPRRAYPPRAWRLRLRGRPSSRFLAVRQPQPLPALQAPGYVAFGLSRGASASASLSTSVLSWAPEPRGLGAFLLRGESEKLPGKAAGLRGEGSRTSWEPQWGTHWYGESRNGTAGTEPEVTSLKPHLTVQLLPPFLLFFIRTVLF